MYPTYKNTITKNPAPTVTINNTPAPPESVRDLTVQCLRQKKLTPKEQTRPKRALSPERASSLEAQPQVKRTRPEHMTTENPAPTTAINNRIDIVLGLDTENIELMRSGIQSIQLIGQDKLARKEKIGLSVEKETGKEKVLTPPKALKLSKPALKAKLFLENLINKLCVETLKNFGSILHPCKPVIRLKDLPIDSEDIKTVRVIRRKIVNTYDVSVMMLTPAEYADKLDIVNYANNRLKELEQKNLQIEQLEQQIEQLEQENLHKKPVEELNNSNESCQNRLKQLMQQRVSVVEEAVLNNSDESN